MLYVCVVTFFGLCKWDGCGSKSPPCWNPWYPINSSPSDMFQPESHLCLWDSKWLTPGWNFNKHRPKICQTRTPTWAVLVSCGTQDALNQEELLKALIKQMSCRRGFKCEHGECVRCNQHQDLERFFWGNQRQSVKLYNTACRVVVWLPLQGQSLLLEKQMKASWKSFAHFGAVDGQCFLVERLRFR